MTDQRYYPSPVDYEAWGKGYTPPTEHVLIDALHFRGARVPHAGSASADAAWWLSTRGQIVHTNIGLRLHALMEEWETAQIKARETLNTIGKLVAAMLKPTSTGEADG